MKTEVEEKQADDIGQLYLKRTIKAVGTVEAVGMQTAEGFVVLAGSHISPSDDDTIPEVIKEKRKKTTLDIDGKLIENLLFTSPSYAAMFVILHVARQDFWCHCRSIFVKSLKTV